jgi:type IV pilus assembly protein PilM
MASTVVGLDIGSSGVRAAEFKVGARGACLRRFATTPLPPGAVRAGVIADVPAVAEALRELWSKGRFSTKEVTFGIANDGVLVRQMDLAWMPPADFRKALRYQVADALPVSVDEANLDYHLLDEITVPGEDEGQTRRMARVLLVAAAREMVDGFVEAVRSAGLRARRADLLPFALIQAARPGSDLHTEAIVDIGADTVSVVVHQGGQPRFVRMITGLGGDTITRALQDRYDWSWEDAERTKIVVGLPPTEGPAGAETDQDRPEHPAQHVVAERVADLLAEVRATLNFFLDSDSAEADTLARVVLAGSGSRLGGLAEVMALGLGVPVEPLEVLAGVRRRRRLDVDADQEARLAVAAGLCMGGPRS